MFDRFNNSSRRIMALARQEALRLNHDYIGTEHLLAALVSDGRGVAASVLMSQGIDLARTRRELDRLVPPGAQTVTMGQLPFTPSAARVLKSTLDEASQLGHTQIATGHLLLGLMREREGIAAAAMSALRLDREKARTDVLKLVDTEVEGPGSGSAPGTMHVRSTMAGSGVADFTTHAKFVFGFAIEEARRLDHDLLGTAHLLLGLLRQRKGLAAQALRNLHVDVDAARDEILKLIKASGGAEE